MAYYNGTNRSGPPPPEPCGGPLPLPLTVPPGNHYALELFGLMEPEEVMKKHGYVTQPLTDAEINAKARCKDCNQTIFSLTKGLEDKIKYRLENPVPHPLKISCDPFPTLSINFGNGRYETKQCTLSCKFHPGVVDRKTRYFTCCDTYVSEATPCVTNKVHQIRDYAPGELAQWHQFCPTPAKDNRQGLSIRAAVAIDCEMGTAINGEPELIRLTAIDYLTGEILINNLVQPDMPMQHLNTRYSGVTWQHMNEANRKRTCLMGKAGAREALWRYVGPYTALVGHAVNNDLRALRWIHATVVDSYLIEHKIVQAKRKAEEEAAAAAAAATTVSAASDTAELVKEPDEQSKVQSNGKSKLKESPSQAERQPKKKKRTKGTGDLALKTLMKKHLGKDIQMEGKGHDSFEDALAARDLIHFMVMQRLMEKGLLE